MAGDEAEADRPESSEALGTVALAIMAKAPSPGTSKTRLSPPLTAVEAAGLSACFITDMARTIADLPPELGARGIIAFTPADAASAFDALLPDGFARIPQRGKTLSERCAAVIEDLLVVGHKAVCLLNADSPTLPPEHLHAAVTALRADDRCIVLGPAMDGGYYLLGAAHPCPELFHEMPWSTALVYEETARRAGALAQPVVRLPAWYDVDDGFALTALVRELFGDGVPPVPAIPKARAARPGAKATRTRAFLHTLLDRGSGPPAPSPAQADS